MAAPAHTARVTPTGDRLDDGYKTVIAFAADSNVKFWEKTVKPPGIDAGDKIPTTTMHNVAWDTFRSRALKTLTDSGCKAAYDPAVLSEINALCGVEGAITIHFPNLDRYSFYGFLKSFEPDDLVDGQQPEASIVIVATNLDPVNLVEADPVFTAGT